MGWLGTAWDYTLGDKGIGLNRDLGIAQADSSNLKEDREGYLGIGKTAESTLGQNYAAPLASAPLWQQAGVTNATWANANANQAGIAQAGSASAAPVYMNQDQANSARSAQGQLIGNLQQTAQGLGPSIAQEQLRQSTNANINQQMAAARSMHGNARLAALRNASMIGAASQQQANSQAAALRAQEIAAAQGQLGNALSTQRGQDVTQAAQQAALEQQRALANAGFQQQSGLANAQLEQGANQFNTAALNAMSQFNANSANAAQLANAGAANNAALAYAGQANSGNQAFGLANLNSMLQTNALNTQRQNAYINALLASQGGAAAMDTGIYNNADAWNKRKTEVVGGLANKAGEIIGLPGFGNNPGMLQGGGAEAGFGAGTGASGASGSGGGLSGMW